jgi:hypothetical protein
VSEQAADAAMDNVNSVLTSREATVLSKYGFKDLNNWSMDDAADVISRIEGNGWKVPDYIDPATYKPGSIDFNAMSAAPDMKMPELPKVPTAGRSRLWLNHKPRVPGNHHCPHISYMALL